MGGLRQWVVRWSCGEVQCLLYEIRKKNFKTKNDFSLPYSVKSCFITKKKRINTVFYVVQTKNY